MRRRPGTRIVRARGEAGDFTSTFVVERMVIHGGADAGEEVPTTLATEPSTPRAVPSTLGVVPSGPAVVPTTLGRVPNAPVAEPRSLAVVPTTPRLRLSTPTVVPSTAGVVTQEVVVHQEGKNIFAEK